jgi:tol-pal system protein YbgF
MHKIITVSVLGASLLVATPVHAQNREHLQMAADVRMLQEQIQQLSLALTQLTDSLKTVNTRLDANEQFQQRRFADQEVLVKNLSSDLIAIRERTQDSDTRLRSLSDEIDALRKTLLALPAALLAAQQAQQAQSAAAVDTNNPAGTPNPAPAPAPAQDGAAPSPPVSAAPAPVQLPPTAGLSPNRLYDTAWGDYTAGQYATAITTLEQLVKTFPTAERADDAQFLIGESLYLLNRFTEAAAAYNLVIQNYPTGDQIDQAYYKRGLAQEHAGDAAAAKTSWEEVVKRYPDSTGASLARQALARLNRQATPPTVPARQ